jgi:hypothetical protein
VRFTNPARDIERTELLMHGVRAFLATLAVVLLSASASQSPVAGEQRVTTELVRADRRPVLPAGWRWESYGGVQVGVPDQWGWGDDARLYAWCVNPEGDRPPVVARPGAPIPAIHCGGPETRTANTGWVVAFDHAGETGDRVEREGDRTTVRLAGVEVVVQAPWGLREQIAATIHRVRVDEFDCPATHPISLRPRLRPSRPVNVAALRTVTTVSACKYELGDPSRAGDPQPWLVSSLRIDGAAAARAIGRIARAPAGGGPDRPGNCVPEVAHGEGEDLIVLRVRSEAGQTEIMLRYAGCVGNGFDDGTRVRQLTRVAVAPFTAGPNAVPTFPEQLATVLTPPPRPGD